MQVRGEFARTDGRSRRRDDGMDKKSRSVVDVLAAGREPVHSLDSLSRAEHMIRHSERRSASTVILGILSAATIFVFAFWVVPPFFHGAATGVGITLGVYGKPLPRS
jgi:hypothetical protein